MCFFIISCNQNKKKTLENTKNSIQETSESLPNIFVVKTIIFSKDSLPVTIDMYEVNNKKPTVVLCHQAGYSRGEYKETALELNNLEFSCVAVDLRSGNEVTGVKNETALKAKEKGLSTNYLDAQQDIEATIDYVYEINGNKPILLVGSSYSASLVLLIGEKSKKVKAVAAFSPGEYFDSINLKQSIKNINKPIFVTSSKNEIDNVEELISLINPEYVTFFKPEVEGNHGSKALWKSFPGNEEYWNAFKDFLQKNG